MTELEKVIDDLGRVMACGQTMLDCGTESPMVFKMIRDAADNAIVFLKAQEPRVMTKEELKFLRHNDVIWLEDYDKPEVIPGIVWRRSTVDTDFVICGGGARGKDEDYEVRWRCWTSRPDQATREATPWN